MTNHAAKVHSDLSVILREAERHGTLDRLPYVAIYFHEPELRVIVAALAPMAVKPTSTHDFVPHKNTGFCDVCGYGRHEPLIHNP